MPLVKMDLPPRPPDISWLEEGLFPRGYVSVIFLRPGEGKTRLLAWLATQVVRPAGDFLGRGVAHGKVVVIDADDPGLVGYTIWLNRFLATYQDGRRELLDLRRVDGGLTRQDVEALTAELQEEPPALIVIDAFASAFLGLDLIKAHEVHAPLRALTDLAQVTGAAVVVADHVGKLAPGQTVAEKGALGSVAKMFSPRAAFALDRVPPREVGGKDVVRLVCTKQSYAPPPPPLGLELVVNGESAYFRPYALPEGQTLEERAEGLILELLKGGERPRRELLAEVVRALNVHERTAERALYRLKAQGAVEEKELPGRGRPRVYTLAALSENSKNPVQEPISFSDKPVSENPGLSGKEEKEVEEKWAWI